jgi:hypothetical protein
LSRYEMPVARPSVMTTFSTSPPVITVRLGRFRAGFR